MESLEGMSELARLARKVRVLLCNLCDALYFFVMGGLITGYWLVVSALLAGANVPRWAWWCAAAGMALVTAGILLALEDVPRATHLAVRKPKGEGLRWVASFLLPFAVAYPLAGRIPLGRASWEILSVIWYPALGVALVAAHLLVYRDYKRLNPGLFLSSPFLIAGGAIVATTPLVLALMVYRGLESAWLMATGTMVVVYTLTGLYVLKKALRVIARG